MNDKIHLSVITAEKTVIDRLVDYVNIPTPFGSVGVLKMHAPMLCAVEKGIVRCTAANGVTVRVQVSDGVANVKDNEVTLLVSDAREISE